MPRTAPACRRLPIRLALVCLTVVAAMLTWTSAASATGSPDISVSVVRTSSASTVKVGSTITYRLNVVTSGNETDLSSVDVSATGCDSTPAFSSGDSDHDSVLDTNETWAYTCSHVVTTGDAAPVHISASASGYYWFFFWFQVSGTAGLDTDLARVSLDKKQKVAGSYTASDITANDSDTISYQLVLTNTGNITLNTQSVTDAGCDAGTLSPTSNATVAAGSTRTYTCTRAAHGLSSPVVNSASASGTNTASGVTAASVTSNSVNAYVTHPAISLSSTVSRTTSGYAATTTAHTTDTAHFQVIVTNTGDTTLTGISVNDPFCSATALVSGLTLTAGDSRTYTCSKSLSAVATATVSDNASASGTGGGTTVSATSSSSITILKPALALAMSAATHGSSDYSGTPTVHVGDTVDSFQHSGIRSLEFT